MLHSRRILIFSTSRYQSPSLSRLRSTNIHIEVKWPKPTGKTPPTWMDPSSRSRRPKKRDRDEKCGKGLKNENPDDFTDGENKYLDKSLVTVCVYLGRLKRVQHTMDLSRTIYLGRHHHIPPYPKSAHLD